jgi:hypothetical protein
MRLIQVTLLTLPLLGVTTAVHAATANGSMVMTGTLEGSLYLAIETVAGITPYDPQSAPLSLGSLHKFGTVGSGTTRTTGASDWTITWTVGIRVTKANITSSNYTLTGQLGAGEADYPATWTANSHSISAAAPNTIVSTGTYASTFNFPVAVKITDSSSAGPLDNFVFLVVTSN